MPVSLHQVLQTFSHVSGKGRARDRVLQASKATQETHVKDPESLRQGLIGQLGACHSAALHNVLSL